MIILCKSQIDSGRKQNFSKNTEANFENETIVAEVD